MTDDTAFDYGSDMKEYYKSDEIAREYHEDFADQGSWRHRVVAHRERKVVHALLRRAPHSTVLDIPTGTGKLAPVFAATGSTVTACDISKSMLDIAKSEFGRLKINDAQFRVCDAENASEVLSGTFDTAVCLRLLHRVPRDTKCQILQELGSLSDYVIASTAVESAFHKVRRSARRSIFDGDDRRHCYETPTVTREIFSDGFDILMWKHVLPILSQERIYLLSTSDG